MKEKHPAEKLQVGMAVVQQHWGAGQGLRNTCSHYLYGCGDFRACSVLRSLLTAMAVCSMLLSLQCFLTNKLEVWVCSLLQRVDPEGAQSSALC